jgi:predicted Zn-dependent protease
MDTKMTMAELPDAVAMYAASGYDPEASRPLLDLIEAQTDYYQKRFWTLADMMKANDRASQIVAELHTNK